jgi:hypothetical protein
MEKWYEELQLFVPQKSVLVELLSTGIFILMLIKQLYGGVHRHEYSLSSCHTALNFNSFSNKNYVLVYTSSSLSLTTCNVQNLCVLWVFKSAGLAATECNIFTSCRKGLRQAQKKITAHGMDMADDKIQSAMWLQQY